MDDLLSGPGLVKRRHGLRTVYAAATISIETILDAMRQPGEILKAGSKTSVRRVGDWVLKESKSTWIGALRHTAKRKRYRRTWCAAQFLKARGIHVPEPIAYVETRLLGCISGSCMISEFLEEQRDVEKFLQAVVQRGGGAKDTIEGFLSALAAAVNAFVATGAYHADLSGKNIYTRDGRTFYFIDLDAVDLGVEYTDERRMKNHVQLYDSFCDQLNDALLVPFIEKMLTRQHDPRVWMPRVRKGQAERRRIITEKWARQGRTGND